MVSCYQPVWKQVRVRSVSEVHVMLENKVLIIFQRFHTKVS